MIYIIKIIIQINNVLFLELISFISILVHVCDFNLLAWINAGSIHLSPPNNKVFVFLIRA